MQLSVKSANIYAERFTRVIDYIDRHLDDPLSVDELSRLANFSRFHFQRQFAEYVGLSVARYIQQMRLRRASYQLVFTEERRIVDIAFEASFENQESFSRAFKKAFEQTPSQFRDQPAWQPWKECMQLPQRVRSETMEVKIVDFEETLIVVLEQQGAPELIFESVKEFIDWRKGSGLSPVATSRTFGVIFSDPETTPPDDFRFDICGEIHEPIPENPQGVLTKKIPTDRCAVVRHIGSTDRIGDSVWYLYRDWLPESREELRDFPLFFHYVKKMPATPEHEQTTDVYLPLK